MRNLIAIFSLSFIAGVANAQGVDATKRQEVHAAMQECVASAAKDSQGKPEHAQVQQCMQAKGVAGGEHWMKQSPEFHAAMKECVASAPKTGEGRPDRHAVGKCMEEKGFKRPAHPALENNPALKAALHECVQNAPKTGEGRPDRHVVGKCMEEKGFKHPHGAEVK